MKSANSLLRVMLVPFAFALFGGALLLHPVKAHAQTSGVFIPTGSMSAARGQHTATLLPNGKVLIAGGFVVSNGSAVPLASAELYDPTTGTFSATGSMSNGRRLHTATLLPNGNVLIAGGYNDNSGTLATAELYSPATGTFSATGSMTYSRFYAAAAMLPEGKVLIAGGDNDSLALATAELYDPLTATFSATGSMNYQRYELTATLLPNGQVLFVEGRDISNSVIGISELYNTSTKTFYLSGSMLTARSGEGASTGTLLANGKVLFVAGDKDGPSYEQLASAELYDPTKGTFSPTGSMTYTRTGERETLLLDGRVLVSGGTFTTPVAELYDPTSGAFSLTGSLITERSAHTATLLPNGTVLIAGGYNNTQVFSSAELYTLQITAKIQPPINSDGSSVFKASRGVVPVKFALVDGPASCNLPNATISLTRIAGGVIGTIDEADYLSSADSGPNFRISDCQYVYNLASKALGIGTYRVDISIAASVVGSAVFGLK